MNVVDEHGWMLIATAPRTGKEIQARIPGHGSDNVIAWTDGLADENGDCGGWQFTRDQEPPPCWTDGVCWASNEDFVPSVKPTHWKPLPRASSRAAQRAHWQKKSAKRRSDPCLRDHDNEVKRRSWRERRNAAPKPPVQP